MIVMRCDNSGCTNESRGSDPDPTWIRIETDLVSSGDPGPWVACSWPCVAGIGESRS